MIPQPADLAAVIPRLAHKRVLVVGDVMLDTYLTGDAERLSPEAPVPVVRVAGETIVLGGAGNVARNIIALGGQPTLIGQVGNDPEADKLRAVLDQHAIAHDLTVSPRRPTTIKTRVLARRQQMLRLDREDASPFAADERNALLAALEPHLAAHDVIILSDYAKGFMSEAFMTGLHRRLAHLGVHPIVLVDPKPANVACYAGVTLLTPNAKETGECAGLPAGNRQEILAAGRAILAKTASPHLLTTLGPDGMALFVSTDEVWHIPTVARDVFDVTGAGDTVIATLALGLAAGQDLLPSCMLANYAAGLVVARVGAATASPEELAEALHRLPVPAVTRWA